MPSDSYYDRMDEIDDRVRNERKKEIVEELTEKFSNMSLEQKIDFLIKEYIDKKIKEIR